MTDPRIPVLERELERRRAELMAAVDAVPPDSRELTPQSGGWSVAMVLEHLAQTERSITGLLGKLTSAAPPRGSEDAFSSEAFAAHLDMPAFLDRTRKLTGSQPSGAVPSERGRELLRETRRELLDALRRSAGVRLEDVSHDHPSGRTLDGYRWVAFLALHEGRHAAQIREIHRSLGGARPS